MPAPLILIILALLGWAWWSGRLKNLVFEDAAAIAAFLLGLRLASTGKLAFGLPLMAGAGAWAIWRRRSKVKPPMPVEDARALLGVGPDATLAEIREAHRRLIAKVHPDAGGSTELAHRVNAARDTLVAQLTQLIDRSPE